MIQQRSLKNGLVAVLCLLVPVVGLADEGMWPINRPPTRTLKHRYGFSPTPDWLQHVQKSCTRIGRGASGSIVSPAGLVMTNHHVGSGQLEKLSTPEHNLLETGFHARTRDEELECKDWEINVLRSIDDVTERVLGAETPGMTPGEANNARRKRIAQIEKESEERTGLNSQVITFFHGAQYHLYNYKRYDDIRLVMAPEQQIAFFGGDHDNFEYPRFDLDMCFFRIYEDGKPIESDHYLKWSKAGAADAELTFVVGHPYRTQRLFTMEHLAFLRDVEIPTILRRLWRREVQLQQFAARSDENARIATQARHGVENSRKAFTGILAGLHDPAIMRQKAEAQRKLIAAVNANPMYRKQWGDAWDQVAKASKVHAELYERYSALEGRRRVLRSDLLGFATHLVRLAEAKQQPNSERLPDYRDSALDSLYLRLYSSAPIHDDLEIERFASGLSYLAESFGGDDPLVVKLLAGQSPRARARSLLRGTKLKDIAERKRLAAGGTAAIASSSDPIIRFAADLDPVVRKLRKHYEDDVEGVERQAYAKIAAAQFAILGEGIYPDANSTLRLSFGPIRGYQEDGRRVEPFTTLAGLYERSAQHGGAAPFNLPQRWIDRKSRLNLDTPYNFVNTADIIGGNSGSPVINRAGEVVGLIFDGNLQGLVWDIAYTDVEARAVAVDSRAIIEALRNVYDAGALADEITGRKR